MMGRMARFLSDEWFALVREVLVATALADPAADPSHEGGGNGRRPVTVRHRVTEGPDGEVDYVVRAGPGRFSIEPGRSGPVDIEVVETYASAAAISQGRLTPAAAFASGRLHLTGDVALLADRQRDFAALGQLLAPVRAATTY
ncbi:MAG: sterol transfer family [Actinomycetota bacterium]|nr:sterol transfer family [Actinomycetota bacterium]